MVIIITGASHVGKTLLAQKMLERYKFPYLSIDHLKMGLIRSGNTDLTPEDDDELTEYLWPIIREIIKTAIENEQNLIVEGCYIPFDWRNSFGEQYLQSIRFISNSDVEHHDAYATFVIGGEPIECFTAFVTTKHFEKEGDRFFDSGTTALVPIDGTDKYYTPEDAENFDEVFGTNTGYVIDPEECMADNFGYLLAYGMDGPDGKGYPNPEIITSIEDRLN